MLSWYQGENGDWCVLCQVEADRTPAAFAFETLSREGIGTSEPAATESTPESATQPSMLVGLFLAVDLLIFVALLLLIDWWLGPLVVVGYVALVLAAGLVLTRRSSTTTMTMSA
jgi:hypothetical protein